MRRFGNSGFTPKIVTTFFEGYRLSDFWADLLAGLTVAVVALPLAVALGIASGASPDKGLVTAIVGGVLISLLGGSRVQIGGPTGAFVVVVFNVIGQYGYDGLIIATAMAGVFLVIAGYLKFGQIIRYIPLPVVTGFTAGIAVVIATVQVREFLGLSMDSMSADFIEQWVAYFSALNTLNIFALIIGSLSLVVGIVCQRFLPNYPRYLIILVLGSIVVEYWKVPVETVGSRFPDLVAGIPFPTIPGFTLTKIQQLLPSAFTIAFLAGIEALLSAVVADGLTGSKHRPNQELIGQGIANIGCACFGGLPATGAIARTAANIAAGGRTPMSGVFHAMFLLAFIYFGIDMIRFVPMPILAAILFLVAWGMSESHQFVQIMRLSSADRWILGITFLLTIFVDLTVAIGVGISIASLSFVAQMSKSVEVGVGPASDDKLYKQNEYLLNLPPDVVTFSIEGPIFFGIAGELPTLFKTVGQFPKVLIVRMSAVPYLDSSGAKALCQLGSRCQQNCTLLVFSELRQQPKMLMKGFYLASSKEFLGYASTLEQAVALANKAVAKSE